MKKSNQFICLTVTTLLLASCGHETTQEDKGLATDSSTVTVKDTTPVTVDDGTKFKFDFALANIPSPAQSMNELSTWGVDYNNAFLNDTKKAKTYSTEFSKAVNLGIYNIDMAYAIVHQNGEDVLKYMKTVLIASDGLGLKGAIDQMVGKRAEQNIAIKDSLLRILDEILIKSDGYLRTNERLYTAAVVFSGSWVESLYLTCKMAESTTDEAIKAKVYKHLWEQRFHLNNLIIMMEDYKDKKEAVDLNADFKVIHKEINDIKKAEDITAAKFKSISEKIYALRDKLTK
jgi:hypothetical protein